MKKIYYVRCQKEIKKNLEKKVVMETETEDFLTQENNLS